MKIFFSTRLVARSTRLVASAVLLALFSAFAVAFSPAPRFEPRAHESLTHRSTLVLESVEPEELLVTFTLPNIATPAPTESVPPAQAAGLHPTVILQAIATVESHGNPSRVGRLGERGLYQFRRATWRQHTREDFSRAHHPAIATTVAHRHYEWIVRELRSKGFAGSPYEVALAWNAGLSRVLAGKAPRVSHDYAQRVVNLASGS